MPKTITTAIVDRLLHHAHILITDSCRLARPPRGKAVKPLI